MILPINSVITNTINQPNYVDSVHADLASDISQSTREKIQRNEYIDLALLLSNNNSMLQDTQRLVLIEGALTVQAGNNKVKITNIEQWTSAFIIFTSIYCLAHPNRFQELLKYLSDVRLGAKRNASLGWKLYDEQYRLRKARNPGSSWSVVDVELWLMYMASNSSPNNFVNSNNQSFPKRSKCYTFNNSGKCFKPLCPYSHSCLKCNSNHAAINCYQLGIQGQIQSHNNGARQTFTTTSRFNTPTNLMHSNCFVFRYQQPQQYNRQRPATAAMGSRLYTHQN